MSSPSRSSLAYSHLAATVVLFIALGGMAAPTVASARVSSNGPIPRAMQAFIAHDAVWIGALGCSGQALRNGRGDVIGVVTAQHCVLLAMRGDRVQRLGREDLRPVRRADHGQDRDEVDPVADRRATRQVRRSGRRGHPHP